MEGLAAWGNEVTSGGESGGLLETATGEYSEMVCRREPGSTWSLSRVRGSNLGQDPIVLEYFKLKYLLVEGKVFTLNLSLL